MCVASASAALLAASGSAGALGYPLPLAPSSKSVWCQPPALSQAGDAEWLIARLRRARFAVTDCTGSAFVVDYCGPGSRGHDVYVWAFTVSRLMPESSRYRLIAGTRVYGHTVRLAWRAGGRNVWIQSGPTTRRLPPIWVVRRIVYATTSRVARNRP
jgi:hypothetical protein